MHFHCIGDEDTVRGFRLAGVSGMAVATASEALTAFKSASASPDCGLVIITNRIAQQIRDEVERLRMTQNRPLVVEIPGREGPAAGIKSLEELVQEAVGMRLPEKK